MKNKRLLWQLYPLHLLVTISALLIMTWFVSNAIRDFHYRQTAHDLEARARLIENQMAIALAAGNSEEVNRLCRTTGSLAGNRFTVIQPDGKVIGDSFEAPLRMDNHSDRPEVIAALKGEPSPAVRYSNTLKQRMMYIALPLRSGDKIIGVLRAATPVSAIEQALEAIYRKIALMVLAVTLLAALVAWFFARRISRPLETIKRAAADLTRGEFNRKLAVEGCAELQSLAESLNSMADHLYERIEAVTRQHQELEAIFASMVEGVFVVDNQERFISINQAGAGLLGVEAPNVLGKDIVEVVRNTDLLSLVKKAMSSSSSVEGDLVFTGIEGKRFFQAHGVPITDADGDNAGALIVLNDITRLRRLEQVRRDFVSNVSHELRTPVTSIKGFVETLREGALEDPEHAKKFLEIIAGQTDRLNAIINDLLALSRIEQQANRDEIKLSMDAIDKPITRAIQACADAAGEKKIIVNYQPNPAIQTRINVPLLEQAFINLIDNAIKYNPSGTTVNIETVQAGSKVLINVTDNGIGIDTQHLPRIFERFYRADSSRSGKNSGTGLGLSIVKHIVQAHHGSVNVTSTFRKGTTFTIRLPA